MLDWTPRRWVTNRELAALFPSPANHGDDAMTMREKIAAAILEAMDLMDGLDQTAAERYADAVLDAMRDPTEKMMRAAATVKLLQGWQGQTATEAEGEHIWQAMIDAARADA